MDLLLAPKRAQTRLCPSGDESDDADVPVIARFIEGYIKTKEFATISTAMQSTK